tara:strand:- start:513 stop:1139 length:627 start_codon:yes stop_codon:yes gene_type:complete
MKATEILNKIKGIVGVELAEESVNLAEMKLENGTVLVAEEFKAGEAIFIKSEEEQIALPVGEYKLENDMVLVVKEEGLISEIKEVEAEKEEEEKEEVEAAELEKEEEKEEMRYVTKEEFTKAVDEIKAMIDKMGKDKEEMSEETATEEVKEEVKEELQETELSATKEEAVEPIKHNPETEQNKKGKFLFGQKRTETTMDRVFSKIASN